MADFENQLKKIPLNEVINFIANHKGASSEVNEAANMQMICINLSIIKSGIMKQGSAI